MSSKAEYEARKAERDKRREARAVLDESDTDVELMECLDRIATAFERIADAMEGGTR
jgi:hypothetical protein